MDEAQHNWLQIAHGMEKVPVSRKGKKITTCTWLNTKRPRNKDIYWSVVYKRGKTIITLIWLLCVQFLDVSYINI